MCARLLEITTIDADVLSHARGVFLGESVAKRISWAARRDTTCAEDHAYYLTGIFGVNMPMGCGEGGGARAFVQLQEEEIMRESSDESLFAWPDEGRRGG